MSASPERREAGHIRVGPAGWSYPDWEGRVYPASKPHGFQPLAFLVRFFDCIEINSSFYAMPRPEHTERWAQIAAAKAGFRFYVKLHRDFTHVPEEPDEGWTARAREFLNGIEPLARARRLGGILVQFPVSFLYGKSEVRRLGRLHGLFASQVLVLEVRHDSWFTPPALATLRGLSFSLAHIDLPPAWNHPPVWHESTGPLGYLRLHGRNANSWFLHGADRDDKYDYLYSRGELEPIVQRARRIALQHDETAIVTNNHFAGKAVANALEILYLLDGAPPRAPPQIVEAFPHLRSCTRSEIQERLF